MIRPLALTALFVALALPVQAETTEQLLQEILDRPMGNERINATIHADGTVSGNFNGQALGGAWEIRDGYYCRSLTLDGAPIGEDCIVLVRDQGGIRFDGEKGAKKGHIYYPAQ